MSSKHLSQDEIEYVVDVKTAKAQQAIHKLETQSASLRNENKQRLQQMIKLEASGKKETEQYKKLAASYKVTGKQIKELTSQIQEQTKSLDTNAMTMSQLRKQSKSLQKELDNVSQALNPKQYADLESRLQTVNARMAELKQNAKNFKELASSDEYNNFFFGQLAVKGIETAVGWFKSLTGTLSDTISKSVELAESADGITHAFKQLDTPGYLQSLRDATKGTVSDIELMKAAVKAKDFRIPLEDLGKYLSFAQLKAQQTGQSLDYMVDSIVTGLGRKSPLILDNLGLSAAEIGEKTKETGDFMKGVASIVEGQLAAAGETYISATDRAARRTVALENAQRDLGEALLPLQEEFSDVYGQIQITVINTIKYLVQHRDTLFALGKAVALLTATYAAYVVGQKAAWAWGMRMVAVSKLKAARLTVENTLLELSVLRHAVLNKTMTRSIALQKAFNIVLKLSPWGLVFGGITLVVGALLMFGKRTDAATMAQKRLNDMKKEAISKAAEEKTKIDLLIAAARDEKLSMDERRKAVDALNRIIPDYNAQLDETTGKYRENKKALDAYLASLVRKYEIEGAKDMLAKLGKEAFAAQVEILKANAALKEAQKAGSGLAYTTSWGAVGNTTQDLVAQRRLAVSTAQSKLKDIEIQQEVVNKAFGKILEKDAVAQASEGHGATGTVGAELDAIAQKIDALKAKRLTIKVGDMASLKKIDSQIAALEKRKAGLENTHSSTGKKTSQTDKVGRQDKAFFGNARKQELDAEQASYNESLNLLKQDLATRKKTKEEYDGAVLSLETAHAAKVLTIEESYTRKAKALRIKDGNERQRIILAQEANEQQARQAFWEKSLTARQQYNDALSQMREAGMSDRDKQELDHKLQLSSLEAFYKSALEIARKNGEDEVALTEAYEAAKAKIISKHTEQAESDRLQFRRQYGLATQQELFNAELEQLKKNLDEKGATQQEKEQAVANLTKEFEERKFQIRQQYGLATQQELYSAELEQLKQHLQNKMMTEEEYEEAVKQMKFDRWKESFDYYSNLFGNALKSLQDAEVANVNAKYDAEIEAAKNAGKDTTELEKKKANETLKIQKKYADVDFAMTASKIIADTAGAIMGAWHTFKGNPVAAGIVTALISATSLAQLAAANSERQKVKKLTLSGGSGSSSASGTRVATGLESGGSIDVEREQDGRRFHAAYEPSKRGYVNKPTVIVGEGPAGRSKEWVASNAAVENPTVSPLIDIIDHAQRAGTIRTLDMNKFFIRQAAGRASGGFLSPQSVSSAPAPSVGYAATPSQPSTLTSPVLDRLCLLLDRLASEGIPASVALDEIEQKQQLREQARKIGSK